MFERIAKDHEHRGAREVPQRLEALPRQRKSIGRKLENEFPPKSTTAGENESPS